ncbi:cytokine-dependent hematopoietic cell linker-like [Antennarius striatus]|uniref:cytokine-dependent hematopoietic cell linker-like n=1 Tax=Antennarius striatus TaxID=241820 RepID=UPI0035B4D43B
MTTSACPHDCSRTDRKRNRRCGSYNSVVQPKYDVVEEDVPEVAILPAKPINDETDYADRDHPKLSWADRLSSPPTGNSSIVPRKIHLTPGPAINRDLKPGRRKIRSENLASPLQPDNQHTHRFPPSPPPITLELVSHLPGLTLHEPGTKDRQKATKKPEFSPRTKGLLTAEGHSAPNNKQRSSLDLNLHVQKRSQQSPECHHEWPKATDDFDGEYLVLMENPLQACCGEDWYVGACNRTDAEHALHLVNKDGAFLVRDCSIGTDSEPLVLVVYHDWKVYNVKIRFIKHTHKYTLGTRQRSDDMFDSVADIIKFHSIYPIILISGRYVPGSRTPENCVLTCPVTRRDVDQLLQ